MGGLDPAKIFLILVIVLIVVGPERLPGVARQLGGMWRELNRLREKFEQEVRAAVPDLDLPNIPTSPSRAITGYLTGLVSGQADTSVASAASEHGRSRCRARVRRRCCDLGSQQQGSPALAGQPAGSSVELAALARQTGLGIGA